MGKKLYVGNLTFSVTNADLEELFAPFGEVRSAQVVEDRQTGRSRGFGFVEMASDADALAAIDALHDQEHNGRRLTVNEAKPREDRGGGGGGGYRGGGGGGGGIGEVAAAVVVVADTEVAEEATAIDRSTALPVRSTKDETVPARSDRTNP